MKTISPKPAKPKLFIRLNDWLNNRPKLAIVIIICLFLISLAAVLVAWFWPASRVVVAEPPPSPKVMAKEQPTIYRSPLTGKQVDSEAATKQLVTAIMIENSPDARPQSGLKEAGVVFGAIAEGGIIRFLALYQESKPQLIGPVRSLRPYYIDWLAPFDPSVAHIGGSANALKEIRNGQYKDIDQFFNAQAYWRATDRYAPHNVYTSFQKLDELNKSKGFTTSNFTGWPRKLDSPNASPTAKKINIDVSSPTFDEAYEYDPADNNYKRSHGTGAHTDREAGQYTPKTVVVIKVPTHIGFEDGYREQMTTTGHGQAYVFQDGILVEGYWQKSDRKAQMKFYDKFGRPIPFNIGQTWITVIAPEKTVTWQ